MRTSWCWGVVAILLAAPAEAAACWFRSSGRSRCVVACCVLASNVAASPVTAAAPKVKAGAAEKLISETWDAAFLQGQKTGYYHTTVHQFTRDGQTLQRVTQELNMTVKREGSVNVIRAESGTEETLNGKVVGVFLKVGLAR